MYTYEVKLIPESIKKRAGLNLNSTLDDIEKVVREFNSVAQNASNPKKILAVEVENGNIIKVILQSKMWFEYPIKALRGFISKLSKISPYSELMTASGRLFKGESVFLEETEVSPAKVDTNMSDEEILNALVKLFFRENDENRAKIEKIKKILLEED